MYNIILIVFRETLEAALFVGIVAATLSKVPARHRILGVGIGLGVIGSILLASISGYLAQALDGLGQDLAQALILATACLMLSWHCITSQVHGKLASKEAAQLGQQFMASMQPNSYLIIMALALTVLREGAETVLFIMGVDTNTVTNTVTNTQINTTQAGLSFIQLALATILGVSAGCFGCYTMFRGLKFFSIKTMFKVTNILLILFIGAMASRLAKLALTAGWVEQLGDSLWNTEAALPSKAGLGLILNALTGYDSQPAQLQLLAYISIIIVVMVTTKIYNKLHSR